MSRPIITCARCHLDRPHRARGLCRACYLAARNNGTLDRYPRQLIPARDILEDWRFLHQQGYTVTQAAERMGVKRTRLEKALERAAHPLCGRCGGSVGVPTARRQGVLVSERSSAPGGASTPLPEGLADRRGVDS